MTNVNINLSPATAVANRDFTDLKQKSVVPGQAGSASNVAGSGNAASVTVKTGNDASSGKAQPAHSVDSVDQAVARLNDHMQLTKRELTFSVDKQTGKSVIKIIDQKTHEVIRQIPDQVALHLAETLGKQDQFNLVKLKV